MAAGAVGSLLIRIGADTGGLRKGGRRAEGTMQRLSRQARQTAARLARLATGAAAAGAALTAALTRRGLQAVDSQVKLARQLGTTQAELAGLTRTAKDAGIEQGQLESNIQALNKRLGEAANGTGQAQRTLDRLGLSAEELAQMPLAERMDTIGAAINGLDTSAAKAAATSDLFSRSGLDMINVFSQGEGVIDRATEEARAFGTAVSEVDAAQVEAANDAMSRISDMVQGVSNQLAVNFAPLLDGISRRFTEAAVEAGGLGDMIQSGVDRGVRAIGFIMDAIEGIRRTFQIAGQGIAVGVQAVVTSFVNLATSILEGPVQALRYLIDQANKIPGVDIEAPDQPEFVQKMRATVQAGVRAIDEGKRDMDATLQEPMPSEALLDWVAEQRDISREAAEQFVMDRQREAQGAAAVGDQMTDEERERAAEQAELRREQMQKNLQNLREFMQSERAAEIEGHEERMEWLREAHEEELISEEEFRARKEQLEEEHQSRLTDIERKGLSEREKFERASMGQRVSMVTGALQQMTDGVASENRKMFELNKASAIANAIISAYQGISTTLGAYPFPLSAVMAAAQAAAAFAQVNAIKSQSFSGGGGAAPSLAGSTPAPPVSDVGGGQGGGQGGGGGSTIINLEGDTFGRDQVSQLIEEINENQRDGGRIILA